MKETSKIIAGALNLAYRMGYIDRDDGIVRCKDCKYRDPEDYKCDCGHDIRWQLPREDNWFCADAERRKDNG